MRKMHVDMFVVAAIAVGWFGSAIIPPPSLGGTPAPRLTATRSPQNAPRPTTRPIPTNTPIPCQLASVFLAEAENEIAPLCYIRPVEWCVEQFVDIGRRARDAIPPGEVEDSVGDLFRDMALVFAQADGPQRDEAVVAVEESYGRYATACNITIDD